ncbi:MAG: hypothetical protein AB1424_18130 [Thermodesulfobacteriota bacterium]
MKPRGEYRPDATCWAILALLDDPASQRLVKQARARLAESQLPDGRVCLSPDHPEAYWPTALTVFAWHRSPEFQKNLALAVHFLITSSGKHWPRTADASVAHDTGIQGWSWIAGTHSWVEPTGLAMMALRIAGYGEHARVREGARLVLDRQLPHGGWNYGNTLVFGQELRPMPLSTGMALNALKNATPRETVQVSLDYLQKKVASLHTPQSLGWSLLGLGAWQARPVQAQQLLSECLHSQERYGGYDTSSLALMLLAGKLTGGLEDIVAGTPTP